MKKISQSSVLLSIAALIFTLASCEQEGPAEKAGKNIDEAVEEMQEKAEDTGDKVMEQVEEATDKVEEAADSASR